MKKILLIILIIPFFSLVAAPKSSLWAYWNSTDEKNTNIIDYKPFNQFLKDYSKSSGENVLISYAKVTPADKSKLNSHIKDLSSIKIRTYSKNEQLVFWVNLYNMLTISTILEHYPIKSILDIKTSGLFKSGPWDQNIIEIEGKTLTLNDIEHRILRPIWKDHRLHYLLNCASIGCPNIGLEAYTSTNIFYYLSMSEKSFLNSLKGVNIDGKTLILSSIFKWYRSDFGVNEEEVLVYISKLNSADLKNRRIKYLYNWDLNEL